MEEDKVVCPYPSLCANCETPRRLKSSKGDVEIKFLCKKCPLREAYNLVENK